MTSSSDRPSPRPPPEAMEQIEEIEELKRASATQLLMKCGRLADEAGLARLRAEGVDLRRSHTALLPYIEHEGTRITELAERLGITKQAVAQRVDELEAMGFLERVPDPRDGRAKLVRFGEAGREGLVRGLGALFTVDEELAARLGRPRTRALVCALRDVAEILESLAEPTEAPNPSGTERRSR